MPYRKITAIIRTEKLQEVEEALIQAGIDGITVTACKGFGQYGDFFRGDFMIPHVRIEIFTTAEHADRLTHVIMNAAHTGMPGDGLVAILPVEQIYRIRTRQPANHEDIH